MTDRAAYALAPHLPLTLGQVKLIEADLLKILAPPDLGNDLGNDAAKGLDFGTALIAQAAYLRLLSRFLNEARADAKIGFDADPEANEPFLDKFRARIENGGEGRKWERLLRAAEKSAPSARLRRVILGSVVAALPACGHRGGVVARYLLFALGRGRVDFGPSIGAVPYRSLNARPLRLDDRANASIFREHFASAIEAEALLAYEDVQFSHHMMLIAFGLAQWAAAALGLRAGRDSPSSGDWDAALRFADGALGPRSDFPARLEQDATLKTVLDALTARPLFPFSMVRP